MNPNPQGYTNLNDDASDEANPDAHFSFEHDHSEARHRTSASEDQASNSDQDDNDSSNQNRNQGQGQGQGHPQRKELSSCFTHFYGIVLVFHILGNWISISTALEMASQRRGLNQLGLLTNGLMLVALSIAFMGLWNKDLGKIETALKMLKIHCPLFFVSQLIAIDDNPRGATNMNPLIFLVIAFASWYFLIFSTTKKVRDTWKTMPEEEEDEEEEEMRDEQARDADPIEKLESWKFIIFKYAILLVACYEVKDTLPDIYEDFADFPKFGRT